MDPIKVAIVEDVQEIRTSLTYFISSTEGFLAEAYDSVESAEQSIEQFNPHIILMDIGLPEINGIEGTRRMKKLLPDVQIMMCTVYEDSDKIFQAIKAGASGYVVKRTPPAQLIEAIKELRAGGSPMSATIARKLINFINEDKKPTRSDFDLSHREWEVLEMLSQGFRNKEVADKLYISLSTVKTHVNNIYQKLHVTSRVEALNVIRKIKNSEE